MKILCALLTGMLISFASTASQRQYTIIAQAVDSVGTPESFATFRIFQLPDTIRPVAGAVTGDDGMIKATVNNPGDYRMDVAGMATATLTRRFTLSDTSPEVNLGKLVLSSSATELSEITVTAMKPLVTREIDRIAYDVKSDPDILTSNVSDILRKVPLMTVEADGTIKLNGQSDFKIYKNGRPNNNFSLNAKDIFQALPANAIKRIEVITDPGAREDAEGSGMILNIITDNEAAIKGVIGTVTLSANINTEVPSPNLNLTTQIGKVTVGFIGSFSMSNRHRSRYRTVTEGEYTNSGTTTLEERESSHENKAIYGAIEASYEPTRYDLISAEFGVWGFREFSESESMMQYFDPDGELSRRYSTSTTTPFNNRMHYNAAINYQRTTNLKGESVTLSYNINATRNNSESQQTYGDLFNPPMMYSGIIADSHRRFTEHTVQLDWARPYGENHVLDLGGKFIFRDNNSESSREYIDVNSTFDDFSHLMTIGAAYADYRFRLGKFSARAGLRYEFSRLSAKYRTGDQRHFGSNLNDFAPNASASYRPNDANMFVLSFNRSINRPGINYLDPTVAEGPNSTSTGNPALKSATFNNLSLNYNFIGNKLNVNASASYRFSNDGIANLKWVEDEHTYSTYGNINHMRSARFGLYARWMPTPKTTVSGGAYASYSLVRYPSENLSCSTWDGGFNLYASQRLPWKLILSGSVYWSSGYTGIYSKSETTLRTISYSLSLQRSFLKENRLTVRLKFYKPFGPSPTRTSSETINTDYLTTTTGWSYYSRSASVQISYRFGSLNAKVRKTGTKISNDDIVGQGK